MDHNTWKYRFGRFFSHVFNPMVICVPLFIAIAVHQGVDIRNSASVILKVVAIATIFPMAYTIALWKWGIFDDIFITNRKQRKYFLPVILFCLGAAVYILWKEQAPRIILELMVASTLAIAVASFITLWYKISLHMTGISSLVTGFFYVYGLKALPVLFILPITAWARLTIKEHTRYEVIWGTLLGIIMTALVLGAF